MFIVNTVFRVFFTIFIDSRCLGEIAVSNYKEHLIYVATEPSVVGCGVGAHRVTTVWLPVTVEWSE